MSDANDAPVPPPFPVGTGGAPLLPFPAALLRGSFEKRYKRFFVDMAVPGAGSLTVHCANSGSMKSCLLEGAPAYALDSGNPGRKLRHSLELLELEDGLACLNTVRANNLVSRFLTALSSPATAGPLLDSLPPPSRALLARDLAAPFDVRGEAKFKEGTRFDFLLERASAKTWLEVKSVSLRLDAATVAFPDSVTERGQKHLRELMEAHEAGDGAVLVFVMMRGAAVPAEKLASGFRAAREIDPCYAALLDAATEKGVKVRILVPSITPSGFGLRGWFRYPAR